MEYNMRNIFIEKSYAKCRGETICRPISKKSQLSISYILYLITNYLYCMPSWGLSKYIETKL